MSLLPWHVPRWAVLGSAVILAGLATAAYTVHDRLAPMTAKHSGAAPKGDAEKPAATRALANNQVPEPVAKPNAPTIAGIVAANGPASAAAPGGKTVPTKPVAPGRAAAPLAPGKDDVTGSIGPVGPATLATPTIASQPTPVAKTTLVAFAASAFPYNGMVPDADPHPFLNVQSNGKFGHQSPRGNVLWQDKTYSDNRVLLSVPAGYDPSKPGVMVVFFHGNGATLDRDVSKRQQVPQQVADSGLNAVLVAPQMAVDAADSSAGHFWEPGFFAKFLDEAADKLAKLDGPAGATKATFAKMPIIVVAYSGGYLPAAYALSGGGAGGRVRGLLMLDAMYGEMDKFADWVAAHKQAFFISSYILTGSQNSTFKSMLADRHVSYQNTAPASLRDASVSFLAAPPDAVHENFVTKAWVADPLQVVLSRIPGYPRPNPAPAQPAPTRPPGPTTVAER